MQPMRPKVVGGAIVVEENGERGGGVSMVFVEGPRGRDGNHPLARAVQWHGAWQRCIGWATERRYA